MLSADKARQFLQSLPSERQAIAFSGGGDSTALVHLCRDLSPKPLVLIIDHQLRRGSEVEANTAKAFAQSLGLEARVLRWRHGGVSSAIQERARHARYDLMGQACRDAGIRYLMTGHTRDDQAETLLMRYEKRTGWRGAAGMAENVYAPLWPELAQVNLRRPLLGFSRHDLRDYNAAHNLPWTEDPSNENRSFERIRARDYLNSRPNLADLLTETASELSSGVEAEKEYLRRFTPKIDPFGIVYAGVNAPRRLIQLCLLAASGRGGPLDRQKLAKFVKQLRTPEFKSATFGNALCVKQGDNLVFGPDPCFYTGRYNRAPEPPRQISSGESAIWGGRFMIRAKSAVKILPSMNPKGQIADDGDAADELVKSLKSIPAQFRGSMPLIASQGAGFLGVGAFEAADVTSECLVAQRLHHMLDKIADKNTNWGATRS